jgi:hypothetical protein
VIRDKDLVHGTDNLSVLYAEHPGPAALGESEALGGPAALGE